MGELYEVGGSDDPQNNSHREREPPPGGVMHDGRRGKPVEHTPSFEAATTGGQDVLHPVGLEPVGESDHESVWRSKDIYWRAVGLP